MTTELAKNIDWVGFVDWSVRDFHSFDTFRGATYNSYLIRDEKTALIDAVKAPYVHYLLENIVEKTELAKVEYVVCNHAEPDHSGGMGTLLEYLPNATLLCNAKCKEALAGYFGPQVVGKWKVQIVTPNDKISLGKRTLQFVNTPMVHWPESMFTYVPEDQILFSMDAFGQHLATSERFDDEYDLSTIMQEAQSYYANIVTPYGKQVQNTLAAAANLPIKIIASSHGLIWRSHIPTIVESYKNWSSGKQSAKVLIVFDSMWDSTTQMAEAILDGAVKAADSLEKVVDVQLMHIRKTSMTRIATEMLDASAAALGSATLNMQMMPQMNAVLSYVKGLKFSSKSSFAFGSFGWASAGAEQIDRWITETGWTKIDEPIKSKFRPTLETLAACKEAGKKLTEAAVKAAP